MIFCKKTNCIAPFRFSGLLKAFCIDPIQGDMEFCPDKYLNHLLDDKHKITELA